MNSAIDPQITDRFHFGFCNACESWACGDTWETIRARADKQDHGMRWGAHAACDAMSGCIDSARYAAKTFNVSPKLIDGLIELALEA